MNDDEEDFTEDIHDDNYLDRLGIIIKQPKPKPKPRTLGAQTRYDWGRSPYDTFGSGRYDSVPPLRTTGRGAGVHNPFPREDNTESAVRSYINNLPAVPIELEHRIEIRREVVQEPPETREYEDTAKFDVPVEAHYRQVTVYCVGDRRFQNIEHARDYCRTRRDYVPGSDVERSERGAEQLMGEALNVLLGFLHTDRGRNTMRHDNPTQVIKTIMDMCVENKLIDAYNIGQSFHNFGYNLSMKKWEYTINHELDTGLLNF